MATFPIQSGLPHPSACTDHVVGAILSGWRYDISELPPHLRGDYEDHLRECNHCHGRQRLHRTIDVLLLAATTVAFGVFLLAALMLHRLRAEGHFAALHVHLLPEMGSAHHLAATITLSLQSVALLGGLLSMLLWVLVAVATPAPLMVSGMVRERISPENRDRLSKQAA